MDKLSSYALVYSCATASANHRNPSFSNATQRNGMTMTSSSIHPSCYSMIWAPRFSLIAFPFLCLQQLAWIGFSPYIKIPLIFFFSLLLPNTLSPAPTMAMDHPTQPPVSMVTPSNPPSSKIRLMCSYGGQILSRRHNNSLCYAGGDTRMVSIDRRTAASFSSLVAHLSRSLFLSTDCPFILKYQLPYHDLDSLISIASDEDLANMFDEYDRLSSTPNSSSSPRIRFFLFPAPKSDPNPPTTDYDPRSETWFFDSLRSANISTEKTAAPASNGPRSSSSDSSSGDYHGDNEGKAVPDSVPDVPTVGAGPESIMLETTSSFGSTGSAASLSNFPAIKGGGGEELGGLQPQDLKLNMHLVDSIGSDTSLPSANLQSPTLVYLDAPGHTADPKEPVAKVSTTANLIVDTESNSSDISPLLRSLPQVYGYTSAQAPLDELHHPPPPPLQQTYPQVQPQPYLQPQYIHPGSNFIPHYYQPSVTAIQGTSYPTVYQPSLHHQQQPPYLLNQPYQQVYILPVRPGMQPHDMRVHHGLTSVDPTHSHPFSSNPMMAVSSPVAYNGYAPSQSALDLAAPKIYRADQSVSYAHNDQLQVLPAAQMAQVQVPAPAPAQVNAQVQAHAHAHARTQAQPVTPPTTEGVNYTKELEDPLHAQIYKTQPSLPVLPSHFQPAATNAASAILAENLAHMQLENSKQQVRTG